MSLGSLYVLFTVLSRGLSVLCDALPSPENAASGGVVYYSQPI